MSIRITELDAITSLQSGDYIAVDNESTGTHKFKALDISANVAGNIANTYSSSASYAIGQYCLYDNNLYKCTTTISTPEAWNSSHWIQVTVGEGLYEKVDKVSGKGLSTNDFTNEYKQKLGGIEAGAEVNVQANWAETNTSSDSYIKNKPGNATTETGGFMSASDKQKLDSIEAGAEVNVQPNWAEDDSSKDDYIKNKPTIDTALSTSSDNAVRNSAITAGINQVQGNLDTEITNRQNAVSGEQLARENADSALDGRLDTVEETLPNKANINGSYEEMTVGSAEQLISTESIEDTTLYTFRASGGGMDIGDRETDKLVGGTVAWNQLMEYTDKGAYGTLTTAMTSNGEYVVNGTTSSPVSGAFGKVLVANHVYLFDSGTTNTSIVLTNTDTWTTDGGAYIRKIVGTGKKAGFYFKAGTYSNEKFIPQYFDLTQMFGATIADAIYAMEQAESGSGVAWFKKYFPKPYYAYDSGSLQSVNVASHDMTGFNQVNKDEVVNNKYIVTSTGEEDASNASAHTGFIRVIPQTDYYTNATAVAYFSTVVLYDANKKYIGYVPGSTPHVFNTGNAYYIIVNTVKAQMPIDDLVVNRVWTGNRNGEYEPYELHSYPYDESVELRGMPSLVDGELVYDGDTYEADGTVARKYGIVDLGSLTWDYNGTRFKSSQIPTSPSSERVRGVCSKYPLFNGSVADASDKSLIMGVGADDHFVYVKDSAYSDATAFKTAMSGVYLVYELATPTSEQSTGFTNPQIVDAFGTEEYVDAGVKNGTRDVSIPVGHVTQYMANLRDKLQHLPNLAKEDGDYFVNQTGTQMKLKKVEGYYEDLVSGMADNLTTKIRANDQTPYLFRTSGGSVDIGDREYINGIVGGTVVFNQLVENNAIKWRLAQIQDGTISYDTTTRTATVTATATGQRVIYDYDCPTNHVMFVGFIVKSSVGGTVKWETSRGWKNFTKVVTAGVSAYASGIVKPTRETDSTRRTQFALDGESEYQLEIKDYQLIDLTQMFGSTIADYIYSLEQATAGAGVAFFKSLFPKPYYAYNSGELMSVKGLVSHDMVGFNAFDGVFEQGTISTVDGSDASSTSNVRTKNYIRIVPSQTYHYRKESSSYGFYIYFYDTDKKLTRYVDGNGTGGNFTSGANEHYVRFRFNSTGDVSVLQAQNVCLNLSWDGSEDGNYEPYQKWSYPLDSDLELRGIPKLDASNNLYYDGDTYESDGTVTRKYGIVDLGTLTWVYNQHQQTGGGYFSANLTTKPVDTWYTVPDMVCSRYLTTYGNNVVQSTSVEDKVVGQNVAGTAVYVKDTVYTDAQSFKTAMSGVYLVYELATPTTETADPYTSPQIVNDFGTEEFAISNTVAVPIPVGHNTDYPVNLKSKLEMAPDSPDGDGDYIVRQTNGTNEYVPLIIEDQLPAVPSTDGTYTLTVTIASGEATYSWT